MSLLPNPITWICESGVELHEINCSLLSTCIYQTRNLCLPTSIMVLSSPDEFPLVDYHHWYNTLRTFEQQRHAVDEQTLLAIAAIFCRYQEQDVFGITLLHRHIELRRRHIMLHCEPDPNTILCTEEAVGDRPLYPYAYSLVARKAVPVEFSHTQTVAPKGQFLLELASFLADRELDDVIGLSTLSPGTACWTEYNLEQGTGTTASPHDFLLQGEVVPTEWRCVETEGVVKVIAMKICVEPKSGGHIKEPTT